MTDIPSLSLKDLAPEVLISELGLKLASQRSLENFEAVEIKIELNIFDQLAIIFLISEYLNKIIIFSDLESVVSFDIPKEIIEYLAKIISSSNLLKEKFVKTGKLFVKNYEINYIEIDGKIFQLFQEIDEIEKEKIKNLIKF